MRFGLILSVAPVRERVEAMIAVQLLVGSVPVPLSLRVMVRLVLLT